MTIWRRRNGTQSWDGEGALDGIASATERSQQGSSQSSGYLRIFPGRGRGLVFFFFRFVSLAKLDANSLVRFLVHIDCPREVRQITVSVLRTNEDPQTFVEQGGAFFTSS